MKTENYTDVLIVGGGPTGLVMAAELARRGVAFRIIDTERGPTDKSKAIGIQSRTMEVFENMGVSDEFIAAGHKIYAANIYDEGKNFIHLDFHQLGNSYPYLLLLPQTETEKILLANLDRLGVSVERQTKLLSFTQDNSGVKAMLQYADGKINTLETKWLIGCDGAHSTVRHTLNIPFEGEEYEEGFQLADVRIDWSLTREEMHIMLHEGWLMAAFPLPGEGNRYRLILDMEINQADTSKTPTLEELQATVNMRSHVPAVLSDPKWTANYRIHRRIVSRLREQRVFIGGDAAHIHSPAAAQGMNTGIQDVFNLAWKLALVVNGHSPESILDSYQQERYPVEKAVLKTTDLLLKMVSLRNPVAAAVRNVMAPILTGFNPVKKFLREKISELSIEYKNSPIVESHHCHALYQAGERMPDAKTLSQAAGTKSIYQMLQQGKHLLLIFDGKHTEASHNSELLEIANIAKSYGNDQMLTCLIKTNAGTNKQYNYDIVLPDEDFALHDTYGIKAPCVYLIRPDGYIGFCSDAGKAIHLLNNYLSLIFLRPYTSLPDSYNGVKQKQFTQAINDE